MAIAGALKVYATWKEPLDQFSPTPIDLRPPSDGAGANSRASISTYACPTVEIKSTESVRRVGTGWRLWFSESIWVPADRKIEFRFQGALHLLVLYNEGSRRNGETKIDRLRPSMLRNFTDKLTFVPAGCTYRECHETDASTRITFLYLDPAAFRGADDGGRVRPPRIYFTNLPVWETASKLKGAIESAEAKSSSYLQALSGVLAHELARPDAYAVRNPTQSRGGLAGWQRAAVASYIEEHLGEQIYLPKLAELARLSVYHFCRAFRQSFGLPAHQYQVKLRMELAKKMLAGESMPVTDIALRLGYSQTSSFSNVFRKATGWTPTHYRREFKRSNNA